MNQVEKKRQQIEYISYAFGLIIFLLLGNKMGSMGIAFIGVGLEAFLLVWSVAGGAMADALGRMLRSRNSKGQYKNAEKLQKSAILLQILMGILGTIGMLLFVQVPYWGLIIALFAPSIFLRGISAVLFGYFQGEGSEMPRTVASVIRQIFLLGFGWMIGGMLLSYGEKVSALLSRDLYTAMYGAAGIALAFTLSEIFVILFLTLIYKASRRPKRKEEKEGLKTTDPLGVQIRSLYGTMWARLIMLLLGSLPVLLGAVLMLGGDGEAEARIAQYGIYLAGYFVPVLILVILWCAGLLTAVGRVALSNKREEHRQAKAHFQTGLHGAVIYGLFFAVLIAVLAEQMSACFLTEGGAAAYLQQGSGLLVFLLLGFYFARVLLLLHQDVFVVVAMAAGNVAAIVSLLLLRNLEGIGYGAIVYAGLIGSGIGCIVLGILACWKLHSKPDVIQIFIVPAAAACGVGLIGLLFGNLLTPHVGNLVTLLAALVLGGIIYMVILLLTRNVKEQELGALPFGKVLRGLGQLLQVF